ncbi:DNA methyltransferase (plasmid) [Bacillus cereus]|uniref:DNA methyltransferase n=1 Tax=Bacillus cereus TaxID=1396 RepID=UPI0001A0CE79|nr:DNA methyltransferase [Bacillus cereus]EEL61843.1 Modification methylase [Bacillus cereus F65185]MCU5273606.1 site-specific DNA-methyltransferase [Bacillus cereus]PFI70051.1 modification methylase [Bacillus cereus]PFJ63122.1 modification methylase [Bacillus cereus]PFN42474.1 modification methylase [Bacillus cereus]
MSILQEQLSSYGDTYWDFNKVTRSGIHKLANYPAMMVAPMQHKIIEDIVEIEGNISNILDPFHGSGTTLVEGNKFNLDLIGIDINPLANLITRVKLNGIDQGTILDSLAKLESNITEQLNTGIELFNFNKIEKWFREDIIHDLTIIRNSIMLEENTKNRMYFWVCLSDLVRKYSNTRSSTFKLHIKEQDKIKNMENNILSEFLQSTKKNYKNLEVEKNNSKKIIQGDTLKELKTLNNESIDLICTSPPYGDNSTTVTYGQFSILSLLWIKIDDLCVSNETLMSNFSAIDTNSLGGKKKASISEFMPNTLSRTLSQISLDKQVKVERFFSDYFLSLYEMIRVLKNGHLMVLTLGNRRVDNIEIQLDEITKEFCESQGMLMEVELKRQIPRKRMPKKVSRIKNHGSVSSMNNETVLILRKKEW